MTGRFQTATETNASPNVSAVIFDLGGVVLESPMAAISRFELANRLEPGAINRAVVAAGDGGAWARYERGELGRPRFLRAFGDELRGHGVEVDVRDLMERIEESLRARPEMVRAIGAIRDRGIKLAAITNNWAPFDPDGLPSLFDVFLESVVEGVRKPEPAIYLRCLDRLDVPPHTAVMLDDLGPNLKPARALGIDTIKVVSARQALADLESRLGFALHAGEAHHGPGRG